MNTYILYTISENYLCVTLIPDTHSYFLTPAPKLDKYDRNAGSQDSLWTFRVTIGGLLETTDQGFSIKKLCFFGDCFDI